jgi:hypothetical protein
MPTVLGGGASSSLAGSSVAKPAKTPSHTAEKKHKKSHWLNNAGYGLYAGVGAIKQIGVMQRAVAHDNPTLMVGLTALLASYPPVFFSHDLYAKLMMMVAFHLSEMAESAVNYNTLAKTVQADGEKAGVHTAKVDYTGVAGMKDWLNGQYFKRLATGHASQQDVDHAKAFFSYVWNDQKKAVGHLKNTARGVLGLGQELGKKAINPKHHIQVPEALQLGITTPILKIEDLNKLPLSEREAYVKNRLKSQTNIYHFENAGAFGGLAGIFGEAAAQASGVGWLSNMVTKPWLIGSNLLQTTGFTATTKTIWNQEKHRVDPSWAKPKLMAVSEGTGTLLCAIGAASWSNDWLLGLYRLGAVLKTPYMVFQRTFKKDGNQINRISLSEADLQKVLRADVLSFVVDGLSAGAILGSPFVAAYEMKHHKSLNPLDWGKKRWQQAQEEKRSSQEKDSKLTPEETDYTPKSLVQLTHPEIVVPIVPLRHRSNVGLLPPSRHDVPPPLKKDQKE